MHKTLGAILVLSLSFVPSLYAQSSDQEKYLQLRHAELTEKQNAVKLKQTEELFSQGLTSRSELDRVTVDYERGVLDTQRARVALSNELPSFRVMSAVKSISSDGRPRVRVRLQPMSLHFEGNFARTYLVGLKQGETIISEPYQQQIRVTSRSTAMTTLEFSLLKDTDELTISILSGTKREDLPVLLQHDGSDETIQLTAPNFSQDGVVGEKVEYPVSLGRFSSSAQDIALEVDGLPAGFTTEWIDLDSKAKVNLIRFGESQNGMKLLLRVFMPAQVESQFLEQVVPFQVRVLSVRQRDVLGKLDLQLRPVGAPRLTLSSENLLVSMRPGERKPVVVTLDNLGGTDAREVTFEPILPVGISAEFSPSTVKLIGARAQARVTVTFIASPTAVSGEYDVKLKARTRSRLNEIESPDQSFRIEVVSSKGSGPLVAVASVLMLGVVGAVIWNVKNVNR